MKKLIILAVGILLTHSSFSQNWDTPEYIKGKKYPGYVILNNGDTLHGMLTAQYPADLNSKNKVSIMLSNQTSCLFHYKGETKRYKPKDLKGYVIAGRHYVSIDYSGGMIGKSKSFLLRTQKGKISTFTYYVFKPELIVDQKTDETQTDYYNRIYVAKTVYYRNGAKPIDNESMALGFKKKMAELVSDNQKLSDKVRNKEKGYRMLNIEKIIKEYNSGS